MATLLDGRKVNAEIIAELKPRVAALAAQGRPP
ncbi:MAG: bifunctional methylenetetrahydrofolate dehydrogenase/methenyltetrahydrofolate cyclohydrolase, partial [Bryobacterales bacterium]|nr:bifunctional methylenetetrahydrofolate dehydrogenase/methenyltetrahydrofolate cyclohydrolase [Bryobacterales bacterium]